MFAHTLMFIKMMFNTTFIVASYCANILHYPNCMSLSIYIDVAYWGEACTSHAEHSVHGPVRGVRVQSRPELDTGRCLPHPQALLECRDCRESTRETARSSHRSKWQRPRLRESQLSKAFYIIITFQFYFVCLIDLSLVFIHH